MKKCLVLGAAGFLGGALEHRLREEGNYVVSVARKYPPYRKSVAHEFNVLDLTNVPDFHAHFFRHAFDEVYQMASEVGGIGYIANDRYNETILANSLKINMYTLEAIKKTGQAKRIFFASSQCVYPTRPPVDPFASERIPEAQPGVYRECDATFDNFAFAKEKLYAEALYEAHSRAGHVEVRIGRLGNVYGPYSEWRGERAKAPAAICRKVAECSYGGIVELWGDGSARRSFTFVDDAIDGILRLMRSDYSGPVNIAHPALVSVKELFETVCKVAGQTAPVFKSAPGPVGAEVRGSHNGLIRQLLKWEPSTSLEEGLRQTYPWIREQVEKALTKPAA